MVSRKPVLIVALLFSSSLSLYTYEYGERDEKKTLPENLPAGVYILLSQARSVDRDLKMLTLREIEDLHKGGKLNADDAVMMSLLERLGGEGTISRIREEGRIINNFPVVRREAVRLLGEVGGPLARTALLNLISSEKEPMALSEIVVALAKIGGDEEGVILRHITFAMNHQLSLTKDNNFAAASMAALEKIASDSGGIKDIDTLDAITRIASPTGGYPSGIRRRALAILRSLSGTE